VAVKAEQLTAAAMMQPLHAYRQAELAIMNRNFYDPREPYAQLRRAFVYKQKPTRTPPHLARHRTGPGRPHVPQPRPAAPATVSIC
jgi:putative two-component system hydrogenase maturation factor HypX/HoxX